MKSNMTLIEKADLAVSDFQSDGGYLNDEQAKKFIRSLTVESKLLGMVTVRAMKSHTTNIDKIKFGSRVMHAGTEATALAPGDRSKPDLAQVQIASQLVKAEIRLSDEVLEDSIEGGSFKQTIMDILSPAVARDLEELAIQGDTASGDAYLAKFDGLLKLATSHVVDAADAQISSTLLRAALKEMPVEYKRDKRQLKFLSSVNIEENYRDSLTSRDTVVGDRSLEQDAPALYNGVPVTAIPLMPEDLTFGVNTDNTSVLLTDPKNIHWGIWRKIKMETDKDVTTGEFIIVVSARVGVNYAEEDAVVKIEDLNL